MYKNVLICLFHIASPSWWGNSGPGKKQSHEVSSSACHKYLDQTWNCKKQIYHQNGKQRFFWTHIKEWNDNKPVRSVTTKFLLVNKSRKKLYITTTAFNILLKPYGILYHQCSILVAEFWYFCRNGKMSGICSCLNTWKPSDL